MARTDFLLFADNATRVCQPNGTWANYSNYRSCVPLEEFGVTTPNDYGVGISEDTTTIYFTGYTVSIVALTVAIWIFIHFKSVSSTSSLPSCPILRLLSPIIQLSSTYWILFFLFFKLLLTSAQIPIDKFFLLLCWRRCRKSH